MRTLGINNTPPATPPTHWTSKPPQPPPPFVPRLLPEIIISDINMPIFSMVRFMLKWAVATIPALIVLWIAGMVLVFMGGGFLMSLGGAS